MIKGYLCDKVRLACMELGPDVLYGVGVLPLQKTDFDHLSQLPGDWNVGEAGPGSSRKRQHITN